MQREINKGFVCGILAAIAVVLGGVLVAIGYYMYNDFYVQVEYFYQYGDMDNTGQKIMYGGFALIGVGVVLFLIGLYFMIKERRQFAGKVYDQDYDEFDDMVAQMAGNKTIFDVFHSENHTKIFSFYRNKTCIFKKGDDVYRGTMEPLEWKAGHPTLWRITLNIGDNEAVCQVSKVDGNILVKNSRGEEIFYRGRE